MTACIFISICICGIYPRRTLYIIRFMCSLSRSLNQGYGISCRWVLLGSWLQDNMTMPSSMDGTADGSWLQDNMTMPSSMDGTVDGNRATMVTKCWATVPSLQLAAPLLQTHTLAVLVPFWGKVGGIPYCFLLPFKLFKPWSYSSTMPPVHSKYWLNSKSLRHFCWGSSRGQAKKLKGTCARFFDRFWYFYCGPKRHS